MKTSTALTLAAAASLVTAAAFVQRGQSSPVPALPQSGANPAPAATQASTPGPRPQDQAPGQLRVVGVMVQRELQAEPEFGSALPFMGSQAHVRLALEYSLPEGGLVHWDRDASELSAFRDDAGQDLLAPDAFPGPFEMMPQLAADGTSIAFVLASERSASPRATALQASGELVFQVAQGTVEHRAEPLDLALGAEFQCGPYAFELTGTGKAQWGDGYEFTLQTSTDIAPITGWFLELEDGTRVELEESMSMTSVGSYSQGLRGEQAYERGTLVLEAWKDPQELRVPFDVRAGLGL